MRNNNSPGPVCPQGHPIAFCQGSDRAGDFLLTTPTIVYYNVQHEKDDRTNNQGTENRIGMESGTTSKTLRVQSALYYQGRNWTDQESGDRRGEENFRRPQFEVGGHLIVYDCLHNNPYATQFLASIPAPACPPLPHFYLRLNQKARFPTGKSL